MKKIAIVRRNGLGDLLCAVPLMTYLKRQGHEITLFVDQRNAPLVPYLPDLGKVVVLPSRGNKYWQLLKVAGKYRSHHFDVAISSKTSPMKLMNFFLFALGAKERIAVVDTKWHRCLINVQRLYNPADAQRVHQALKCLRLVYPEAQEISQELVPQLILKEAAVAKMPGPYLLLSATTTRHESRFEPARYARIVNRLERDFSVIVLGQPQDKRRAEAIAAHLHCPHQLVIPESFHAFLLWVNLCDLYFIGDGGIGHLGAALGKSGVVAYGDETTMPQWHPLSKKVKTLSHPDTVNQIPEDTLVDLLRGCYDRRDDL